MSHYFYSAPQPESMGLSLSSVLGEAFRAFLEVTQVLGIGAVWRLSSTDPGQSLGMVSAHYPTGSHSCGAEPISIRPIDPLFCQQLSDQRYEQFGGGSMEGSGIKPQNLQPSLMPQQAEMTLPEFIQATLPLGEDNPDTEEKLSPASLCKTYIVGFELEPSGLQWLIVWSREELSKLQLSLMKQQAKLFQQHLIQKQVQDWQTSQIELFKEILQQTNHQLKTQFELTQLHADLLDQQLSLQRSRQGISPVDIGASIPTLQASVAQIQATLARMRQSLKRLTDCSPAPQIDGPHELFQLFDSAIQELEPLMVKKQLRIDCERQRCPVQVDAWQIIQVFQNLLHNAIAFSPTQGQILCQWQRFQSEVLIQVSDQGPGLKEAEINRIFTPFYSTRLGGIGLGLSIARKIVLAHRGRIWAESLDERGTQISIVLPLDSSLSSLG